MSLGLVRGEQPVMLVARVIGILALVVEPALAIDCTKARKPAEMTICADPEVRNCDQDMSNAYESLRRSFASEEFKTVRHAQRAWISDRNAACGADALCLLRYCRERIAVLTASSHRTRDDESRTTPPAPESPPKESAVAASEVPLVKSEGVYKVLATINGQLQKLFILDSGASEVTVPAEVFLTLFPETVDRSDLLPGADYQLADGRVIPSDRFRIRSLAVGTVTFKDVPASVGPPRSPLLLGQGVLTQVGRWSIDNVRGVLVLGEPAAGTSATVPGRGPTGGADQHSGGSEQVDTVRRFYRLIADRAYSEAWALFASSYQNDPRAEFGAWVRGFAETKSIDVRYATLKSSSADTATVAVELVSIDGTAAGDISKRFAGTWNLVRDGGRWRLAHPNIRLVGQRASAQDATAPGTDPSPASLPRELPRVCMAWETAPVGCAVGFVREYYRDLMRRDAASASQKWRSLSLQRMQALLADNEIAQVQNLTLLRGDDSGATVLVDVIARDAGKRDTRWCGPIELERTGREWKITTTRGLSKTASGVPCSGREKAPEGEGNGPTDLPPRSDVSSSPDVVIGAEQRESWDQFCAQSPQAMVQRVVKRFGGRRACEFVTPVVLCLPSGTTLSPPPSIIGLTLYREAKDRVCVSEVNQDGSPLWLLGAPHGGKPVRVATSRLRQSDAATPGGVCAL